jgi:hypothetical protein
MKARTSGAIAPLSPLAAPMTRRFHRPTAASCHARRTGHGRSDRHRGDMKGDGNAATEGRGPQTGPQVVAASAALRRIHQTKTMGDDAIAVALRPCGAGISRDVVVELEEGRLRFRSEGSCFRNNLSSIARPHWVIRWRLSSAPGPVPSAREHLAITWRQLHAVVVGARRPIPRFREVSTSRPKRVANCSRLRPNRWRNARTSIDRGGCSGAAAQQRHAAPAEGQGTVRCLRPAACGPGAERIRRANRRTPGRQPGLRLRISSGRVCLAPIRKYRPECRMNISSSR